MKGKEETICFMIAEKQNNIRLLYQIQYAVSKHTAFDRSFDNFMLSCIKQT